MGRGKNSIILRKTSDAICPRLALELPSQKRKLMLFIKQHCSRCLVEEMKGCCDALANVFPQDSYLSLLSYIESLQATCPDCSICPFSSVECPFNSAAPCRDPVDTSVQDSQNIGNRSTILSTLPTSFPYSNEKSSMEQRYIDMEKSMEKASEGWSSEKKVHSKMFRPPVLRGRHGEKIFREWCAESDLLWCFSNDLFLRIIKIRNNKEDKRGRVTQNTTEGVDETKHDFNENILSLNKEIVLSDAMNCLSESEFLFLRKLARSKKIHHSHMPFRSRRVRCYVGLPDYFCYSPINREHHFFAEVKYGKTPLSKAQEKVFPLLAEMFDVWIVRIAGNTPDFALFGAAENQ